MYSTKHVSAVNNFSNVDLKASFSLLKEGLKCNVLKYFLEQTHCFVVGNGSLLSSLEEGCCAQPYNLDDKLFNFLQFFLSSSFKQIFQDVIKDISIGYYFLPAQSTWAARLPSHLWIILAKIVFFLGQSPHWYWFICLVLISALEFSLSMRFHLLIVSSKGAEVFVTRCSDYGKFREFDS